MHSNELKIDARRKKILEILGRSGRVQVAELCRQLDASAVTIRNDLDAMERSGALMRIPGGAIPRADPALPSVPNSGEKHAIALAALEMISDGDTLFLNSGTTTFETARALRQRRSLNIVTSSLAIAGELSAVPSFRVILLGGELNPQYGFTKGGDAQEQLRKYQADFAVLSVDGVSAGGGVTTYHADEASIDAMMIAQSAKTLLVADHTKIGHAGFSQICPIAEGQILITGAASPAGVLRDLEMAGVRVVRTA